MISVDTEAPTCGFCQTDIVLEETGEDVRVNWERPDCTDNSGVLPEVWSNIQSGTKFLVPSDHVVQYKIKDAEGNEYTGCTFKVTVNSKYPSVHVENVKIRKKLSTLL